MSEKPLDSAQQLNIANHKEVTPHTELRNFVEDTDINRGVIDVEQALNTIDQFKHEIQTFEHQPNIQAELQLKEHVLNFARTKLQGRLSDVNIDHPHLAILVGMDRICRRLSLLNIHIFNGISLPLSPAQLSAAAAALESHILNELDSLGSQADGFFDAILTSLNGQKLPVETATDRINTIKRVLVATARELLYQGRPADIYASIKGKKKNAAIEVIYKDVTPRERPWQKTDFPPLEVREEGSAEYSRQRTNRLFEESYNTLEQRGLAKDVPSSEQPLQKRELPPVGMREEITTEDVRRRMRQLFQESGKTLEEVGLAMGFAKTSARARVHDLLNRATPLDIRLSTLLRFARAIGRSPHELFPATTTENGE